jgi:hypothetical protein
MANRFAIANGGFNNSAIWSTTPTGAGGASVPTVGDNAIANSRIVTISADATCDWVINSNFGGATGGGRFDLISGVTLTANVSTGSVASCVFYTGNLGNSAIIIGNITGAVGSSGPTELTGARNESTGTLNIVGNITGGNITRSYGVYNISSGTVNITGNILGGSGGLAYGIINNAGLTTIVGNITGGSAFGVFNGTGTVNITGNVIQQGAANNSTGNINIYGSTIGGIGAAGASNNSTGFIYATKAIGNEFGLGSVGIAAAQVGLANSQNGRAYVEQVEFGPRGATPISGPVYILPSNQNTLTGRLTALGGTVTFYNSLSIDNLLPPASSIRLGTVYNVGNSTGTMAVPSVSAVQFGVAVDNTVGNAALSPSTIWNYSRLSATEAGSMGDRLRNAATAQSMGQQIASFNL